MDVKLKFSVELILEFCIGIVSELELPQGTEITNLIWNIGTCTSSSLGVVGPFGFVFHLECRNTNLYMYF